MAKYIDADLLRKEIKRLEKAAHKSALGCADSEIRKFHEGKDFAYQNVGILIDSLQQEQPEVNFKIEERKWVHDAVDNVFPEDGDFMSEVDFRKILKDTAQHFYELGLNAKEEKI